MLAYRHAVGTIALEHIYSHEVKTIDVLESKHDWKLYVRWGLSGTYIFDLKQNVLIKGRTKLHWCALSLPTVIELWKLLENAS